MILPILLYLVSVSTAHASKVGCLPLFDLDRAKPANWDRLSFVKYFAPFAVEFSETTGFPTSVALAQLGLESNWGRGYGNDPAGDEYRKTYNIYHGVSCDKADGQGNQDGPSFDFTVKTKFRTVPAIGICGPPRPKGEKRYYFKYETPAASMASYMWKLMNGAAYSGLRSTLAKNYPKKTPSSDVFNSDFKRYAADPKYTQKLAAIIKKEKLDQFNNMTICNTESLSPAAAEQDGSAAKSDR